MPAEKSGENVHGGIVRGKMSMGKYLAPARINLQIRPDPERHKLAAKTIEKTRSSNDSHFSSSIW